MRLPEPSARTPETDEAGGRKPDARTPLADEATRHALAAAFRRVYERGAGPAPTNDAAPEPAADSGQAPTAELMPAELAAWLQLQRHSLDPASPAESSPAPAPQAGLADLLEKHVRLLLVDPRVARAGGGGRLMLRMAEDVLPATDLWLSRATGGWRLRVDCARADSLEIIRRHAPALQARFAQMQLGTLDIEFSAGHDSPPGAG